MKEQGHPRPAGKTWHNLSLTLGSRHWTVVCQSGLWPATEHCVHPEQAVKPWGCAEDGWVQLHHLPALSIQVQLMPLLQSVAVKLGMPLHFYCSPAITFLSPNPSSTQPLLQYCTYPSNSFVIPWLPFQPFQWLLSLKMESSLFLLWGAGRREQLLLQHHSVVCLCVWEEVGKCKIICRCTKQYNGNCIIKIL